MILSPTLHTPFSFSWLLQMLYRNFFSFWSSHLLSVLHAWKKKKKAYSESPIVHQYRLGYCLWFLPTNLMIQVSCRRIWCIWSWLSFIYIWIPRIFFCNSLKILCIFLGLCKTSGSYSENFSCSGLLFSSIDLWICFCVHTTLVSSLEACNKPYSLEW